MESVEKFKNTQGNYSGMQVSYESDYWRALGADKLVKEGACMFKDTTTTAIEFRPDLRYWKHLKGKKCT